MGQGRSPVEPTRAAPNVVAPNQRALWLLDRLAPDSAAYNLARSVTLSGPLDVAALRRALNTLVQRHEVLRTRFENVDDEPVPVVVADAECTLPLEDLGPLPRDEQLARAERLAREEAGAPFALDRCPLLRTRLLRFGAQEHRLLLTLHHVIADDWSLVIFWRELAALYDALLAGTSAPLEALPMRFADHAQLQQAHLQGDTTDALLAYWRRALAELPVLALPTDRPRPNQPSCRGRLGRLTLDAELVRALRRLARAHETTLFTTLLAALQVLMSRYSGQEDIPIGVPVLGRSDAQAMGVMGYFVNMLVIRGDLSGAPTFIEHLVRLRTRTASAYAHQALPFDRLVKELAPQRDPSRNPFFQVSLTKWAPDTRRLQFTGLAPARIEVVDTGAAMFDLSFTVAEEGGQCELTIEYATDLFDEGTIECMAGHFTTLLEGIVDRPDAPVGELPLLTPAERHRLLAEWNDTAVDWPHALPLTAAFEVQAQRAPDAPALVDDNGRQLGYAQLNARANRLAHRLRALGAAPDMPVALCMHRCADSLVAVLAILKAGATYLPVDPHHPTDRIEFMLGDAGAALVLCHGATRERLPRSARTIVCVDAPAEAEAIARCADGDPATLAGPGQIAYIIYTSGSTGTPKGVQIPYRGIANHLCWIGEHLRLAATDRLLLFTAIGFDASVWEMLAPLRVGACLCLARPDGERDTAYLAQAIAEQRVTVLQGVPSMLRALLDEPLLARCDSLRHVVSGGEPLDHDLAARLLARVPQVRLGNFYGPTETSIDATVFELDRQQPGTGLVPIGRPVANTRCHVLDGLRQLVPVGVVGELYVGGTGLARGYLNRPELTRERFVADPFRPGERLYRTGDLVRYLADGSIAFVGRNDDQVKIRGFRIEPAEIAAVLATHPQVHECHVMANRQWTGEIGLTAYAVLDGGAAGSPAPADLRRFLAAQLPDYMVPVAFVALPAMPLTINGKVDVRTLPAPTAADTIGRASFAAPRDAVEHTMCRVWAEVLGLERVGLDDNFFEIGGHSLLAARLFARLADQLGQSPLLGILFVAPTVRLLAEHYRGSGARAGQAARALVALRSDGSRPPLYLLPGVFGNVVGYVDFVRELGQDQPVYGLQSLGLDGLTEPIDSIEAMARHYLAEVREHQSHGPYAIVGVCFGATVAYEMARQLMAAGEVVAFLGLIAPAAREGNDAEEPARPMPRVLRRAVALGSLIRERLRVYITEMHGLGAGARLRYLVRKLKLLSAASVQPHAFKGARRELDQLEVYRANVHALESYSRRPLEGVLHTFEVFEYVDVARPREQSSRDWAPFWQGTLRSHALPGRDSGDMLQGAKARGIAGLLSERLRAAFERSAGR